MERPHRAAARRPETKSNAATVEEEPVAEISHLHEESTPISHNLPLARTSFVGRQREMAEIEGLLAGHRLLTLTGPGGCGKSSLALAVASRVVGDFTDGVWLVELASLSDPDLVAQEVASALGVRETPGRSITQMLVEHLKPKKMLLLLDNCEHLVTACAALADALLGTCPGVKILATGREALNIAGETSWPVPPLSVPEAGPSPDLEDLERYESVRLFSERARSRLPSFELTRENAGAVAEACRKLDGMPLAIELAAARAKVLTAAQISDRLDDRFRLLTGGDRTAAPRQQTLRATMDWSHDLLSEEEQTLFRRLSAFAGGFTLGAAEEVCAGEEIEGCEVLDLFSRLADKSLVVTEHDGEEARYRLLETVRQYGQEKLEACGEAEAVANRHAAFFLALAEEAETELKGPRQVLWMKRLAAEQDNLRAAMRWLLGKGKSERAARLGWALWFFWWLRGDFTEGRRWMGEALAKDAAMPATARARALFVAGVMAGGQDDYRSAEPLIEESLGLFEELEDERGTALALAGGGLAAVGQGRHEEGTAFLEKSVDLYLGVGDKWGAAIIICFSAVVWLGRGDHGRAKRLAEQALTLSREVGDRAGTAATALYILASLAHASGDPERARGPFGEALEISAEAGDGTNVAYCLEGLAGVAAARGEPVRAACLWGATEALLEEIEVAAYVHAPIRSLNQGRIGAARSTLGEEAFAAAWAQGGAMTPEEAVAYALDEARLEAGPAAVETLPELRIFALGPVRVYRGGRALVPSDWGRVKSRELLFYLLSYPSRTREQIGLALWPDASASQLRRIFHVALHGLRKALGGPPWIFFEEGRYAFDRSLEFWFDVEVFESNLAEGRRLRAEAPEEAIRSLEEAVKLYGGDFLEELADAEWALDRREELRRRSQEALLSLGGLLFDEARHAEAADAYRKAIARDGYSEAAHRGLMRCYTALGERGRAIRHYHELAELLDEELGSPPAHETTMLFERLRKGE